MLLLTLNNHLNSAPMNVDTTESPTAVGLLTALSDNDTPPPGSSSSGLATLHAKTSVKLLSAVEVHSIASRMRAGLQIADRTYHRHVYHNVFLGSDAVRWMLKEGVVTTSQEAVLLGQRMEAALLLHHVQDAHVFLDKDLFYRFYADEEEGEASSRRRSANVRAAKRRSHMGASGSSQSRLRSVPSASSMGGMATGSESNNSSQGDLETYLDALNDDEVPLEDAGCWYMWSKGHMAAGGIMKPSHPFVTIWELLMLFPMAYVATVLPFVVFFVHDYRHAEWTVPAIIVSVFFVIDMGVRFNTGVKLPDGRMELRRRAVTLLYLRSWFIVDLVSLLPWDLLVDDEGDTASTGLRVVRVARFLRLLRLLRLLKLMEMPGFMRLRDRLDDTMMRRPATAGIIKLTLFCAFIINILGGIWHFMGYRGGMTWLEKYCPDPSIPECMGEGSLGMRYLTSVYYVMTVLSSTGFGDILPVTPLEYAFTMLLQMMGSVFVAVLVGSVMSIVAQRNRGNKVRTARMEGVQALLLSFHIPRAIRTELRSWANSSGTVIEMADVIDHLPEHLRRRVLLTALREVVGSINFFQHTYRRGGACREALADILWKLKCLSLEVGDYIAHQGVSSSDYVFFLSRGDVVALRDGTVSVHSAVDGDMFGLGECFLSSKNVLTYLCVGDAGATIYFLLKEDLLAIIREHKGLGQYLQTQVLEEKASIEEIVGKGVISWDLESSLSEVLGTNRGPVVTCEPEGAGATVPAAVGSTTSPGKPGHDPDRVTRKLEQAKESIRASTRNLLAGGGGGGSVRGSPAFPRPRSLSTSADVDLGTGVPLGDLMGAPRSHGGPGSVGDSEELRGGLPVGLSPGTAPATGVMGRGAVPHVRSSLGPHPPSSNTDASVVERLSAMEHRIAELTATLQAVLGSGGIVLGAPRPSPVPSHLGPPATPGSPFPFPYPSPGPVPSLPVPQGHGRDRDRDRDASPVPAQHLRSLRMSPALPPLHPGVVQHPGAGTPPKSPEEAQAGQRPGCVGARDGSPAQGQGPAQGDVGDGGGDQ